MEHFFLYENYKNSCISSHKLLKKAMESYGINCSENIEDDLEILDGGKPIWKDKSIYFSISHSHELWGVYISSFNCGLDLQKITDNKWSKISARFFNKEEQQYVVKQGKEGFFLLWVRKEALGKAIGKGFFGEMPSLVEGDNLLNQVFFMNKTFKFENLNVGDEYRGVVCIEC